jgi:hypothetical protein
MKVPCSKVFNGACCEEATSGDHDEDWPCRGVGGGGCEGVTTRGVYVAVRMVFDGITELSKDDINSVNMRNSIGTLTEQEVVVAHRVGNTLATP